MRAPRFSIGDIPHELINHGRNAQRIADATRDCGVDTGTDANVKRPAVVQPVQVPQHPEDNPRVRIHVCHYRTRLADPGNLQAKAAIDECVRQGILPDDSARYVEEEVHTQVKVSSIEDEQTIIYFRRSK